MDLSGNSNSGRRGLSVMDLFTQADLIINDIKDCNNTECPISLEPIERSGPLTPGFSIQDVLLDPNVKFIKVPEIDAGGKLIFFTCYSKSDFINYIKNKITDNIIDNKDNYFEIQSPATMLPIPLEIIEMLNSVFHIDSFVTANEDIVKRNEYAYNQMILPTFYYSYDNPNNYLYSDNIFFLNYIYQYIVDRVGRIDSHDAEIDYARNMVTLYLTSYIDLLIIQGNNIELKKFQEVQNHFLPIVSFKTNPNGRLGYDLHLDNHPYFMPQFREIFTNQFVKEIVNNIDRVAGVKTRRGTQLWGKFIAVHGSSKLYKELSQKSKALYNLLDADKKEFYRRGVTGVTRITLAPSSSSAAAGNAAPATATMDVDSDASNSSNSSNPFTVRRGRRGGSKKKKRKTLKKKKNKKRKTLKKKKRKKN